MFQSADVLTFQSSLQSLQAVEQELVTCCIHHTTFLLGHIMRKENKTKNVLNQQDLKFVFHLLHWVQECKCHHYSFTYPEAKLLKKIPLYNYMFNDIKCVLCCDYLLRLT